MRQQQNSTFIYINLRNIIENNLHFALGLELPLESDKLAWLG